MLDHTKVTDAGLAHLAGLKDLRSLDLNHIGVTDAGITEFKKSLPGSESSAECRIRPWRTHPTTIPVLTALGGKKSVRCHGCFIAEADGRDRRVRSYGEPETGSGGLEKIVTTGVASVGWGGR